MSGLEPYSAVIRTIAHTRDLDRLLRSLARQTAPPKETLIAIPEGVEPWPVDSLPVRFVPSRRGMVSQRAEGILKATNRFLLLLDDDVVLAETAAAILVGFLASRRAHCVVPYTRTGWPRGFKRWLLALSGIAVPRKAGGIEYLPGGGYYYPSRPPPPEGWPTSGGLGQILALDRSFALEHGALGDRELEMLSRYPIREDGAFVLLVARAGGKCLMVPGVEFVHAGDGRPMAPGTALIRYQAQIENHYLFWKRHLKPVYSGSIPGRLLARFAISCHIAGSCMLAAAASVRSRRLEPIRGALRAVVSVITRRSTRVA